MRQFKKIFRQSQESTKSSKLGKHVEHPTRQREQIEFIAKIIAGLAGLTYISGYLIETTYLGSFGLRADEMGFLRAKYLYSGFHYWLCVSVFLVFLLFGKRFFDFIRAYRLHRQSGCEPVCTQREMEKDTGLDPVEEREIVRILEHKIPPSCFYLRPTFGDLRWNFIVLAIVFAFSLQIMFIDVAGVVRILPFQCILLLSIALQQSTHIRESYSFWGILYGRQHVGLLRLLGAIVDLILIFWIILRVYHHPRLEPLAHHPSVYWIGGFILTLIACYVPFSLINNRRQMERFDISPSEKLNLFWRMVRPSLGRTNIGGKWNNCQKVTSLLILVIAAAIFVVLVSALTLGGLGKDPTRIPMLKSLISFLTSQRRYCFFIVGYITQILAFYIPLNIILLNILRENMYRRLKVDIPKPVASRRLSVLFLRIATISILYLASILSFTHIIYGKIPEDKAGGNYEGARLAHVHLIRDASLSTCCSDASVTEQVKGIVLVEDSNWLYLAPLKEKNCPINWGKSLFEAEWVDPPYNLPRLARPEAILAINRNSVAYIDYTKRTTESEIAQSKGGVTEVCPAPDPPQP